MERGAFQRCYATTLVINECFSQCTSFLLFQLSGHLEAPTPTHEKKALSLFWPHKLDETHASHEHFGTTLVFVRPPAK